MPATTADDLKSVMRRVASSVAVISAYTPDGSAGITATSVTSVTMRPPSLLVCVNQVTRLHRAVLESRRFRVTYLSDSQHDVAQAFGSPYDGDRFSCGNWDCRAPYGPRLLACLGDMTCTLADATAIGTHSVFIGTVKAARQLENAPLLYCNGEYACLQAGTAS